MKVLILGVDGYLGWPLVHFLKARGHEVAGIDNFFRRAWVEEVGSHSATPVPDIKERLQAFRDHYSADFPFFKGDITDFGFIDNVFARVKPDAIVHLAEMPSAPYSMMDVKHAAWTQQNNIIGTLNVLYAMKDAVPHAHLLKLGTMGEYGIPNIDIPEGFFEIEFRGRKDRLPFPRQAGSWYHQSKVHDSNNIMMACRLWGLRSTDIMQGIVFGLHYGNDKMLEDPRLMTRFDFDQCFGTAINRFCCQAVVGHPISPYGQGHQKRGFLALKDSMQCLTLALENPPSEGEYRVFNQFAHVYDITELARRVNHAAVKCGLMAKIRNIENPRIEPENHYYNPDHRKLLDLGYQPTENIDAEIESTIRCLLNYRDRIELKKDVLIPDIHWDGTRKKVHYL